MLATTQNDKPRYTAAETEMVQRRVESNLRLVTSIALKVFHNINGMVELEELISLGTEGLIQAAMRYDDSKSSAFTTFAYYRIRGAIYDGLGDIAPLPRWMYRRVRAAKTVDDYLELGEEYRTDAEGTRVENLQALFVRLRSAASLFITSLDGLHDDEGHPAQDEVESPHCQAAARETAEIVCEAIARLPEREAALIRLHYFEQLSLVEAGRRVGVSKSWASRLHGRAIEGLRVELGEIQSELI